MNAPLLNPAVLDTLLTRVSSLVLNTRPPAVEVGFFVERYHRAFAEEAARLALLLDLTHDHALGAAVTLLSGRLQRHVDLQEDQVFPAYVAGAPIEAELFAAWMDDNAALADAARLVRAVSARSPSSALVARVVHFVAEVERHIVDELTALSTWAGA